MKKIIAILSILFLSFHAQALAAGQIGEENSENAYLFSVSRYEDRAIIEIRTKQEEDQNFSSDFFPEYNPPTGIRLSIPVEHYLKLFNTGDSFSDEVKSLNLTSTTTYTANGPLNNRTIHIEKNTFYDDILLQESTIIDIKIHGEVASISYKSYHKNGSGENVLDYSNTAENLKIPMRF